MILSVIFGSDAGSGVVGAVVLGVPLTTLLGGLGYVYRELRSDVKNRDAIIVTKDAEIARLNESAAERADRLTPLVIKVTELVPRLAAAEEALLARTPTPDQVDRLAYALDQARTPPRKPQARRT